MTGTGWTPLHIAGHMGRSEAVRFLLQASKAVACGPAHKYLVLFDLLG